MGSGEGKGGECRKMWESELYERMRTYQNTYFLPEDVACLYRYKGFLRFASELDAFTYPVTAG